MDTNTSRKARLLQQLVLKSGIHSKVSSDVPSVNQLSPALNILIVNSAGIGGNRAEANMTPKPTWQKSRLTKTPAKFKPYVQIVCSALTIAH